MAKEKNAKRAVKKTLGGFIIAVLTMALCAVVYVASVLLHPEENALSFQVVDDTPVTRLQAGDFTDQRMLRDTFGAMLPTLPHTQMEGQARNMEMDGQTVRHVHMCFENGAEITAVRPASAAALLLREGLAVSTRTDVQVLRTPAMLAGNGETHCIYFEYDGAAYAFYADGMAEEDFLLLAATLEKVQ